MNEFKPSDDIHTFQIRQWIPGARHGPVVHTMRRATLNKALQRCRRQQLAIEPGVRLYVTYADQPGCDDE